MGVRRAGPSCRRAKDVLSSRSVIDFRARPNTPEFHSYLAGRQVSISAGSGTFVTYRAEPETLEEFIASLDATGIGRAVFGARSRAGDGNWTLTSDFVSECIDRYEDRLVGFAGLDITNVDAAVAEVRHAVFDLRLTGVAIDPFRLDTGADDLRLDPIYELCQELHVPIIITLGGWPGIPTSLRHAHPLTVDDVAGRFPALTLIATHGAWPFTQDMVAVAWRRENVYFDNSPFHHAPGASLLVEAAETMVGHKMLYASAYPFAPLAESLDRFRELPFDESVKANVLYGNADRLLRKITADREAVGIPVRPYLGGDRHDEG